MAGALLVTILCCLPLAVANAAANPSMPECQLTVTGGQAGQITAASMSCEGRVQADIAIDKNLLGRVQADFTGVSVTSSCRPKAGCLITVCSGTLVLRDSSVSWVAGGPLENLVCVLGSSHVELHNSRFMHNAVRPLACFDQSHLVLRNSSLSHNVVRQGSGGGLSAEGGATVVITDRSRVHNNSAGQFGGGVLASGKANLTLTGGSSVTHNDALNRSGGGVAVMEDASLTISGRSSVSSNTAERSGGGVMAKNNTVAVITDCSVVHDNIAGRQGGGVSAWDNARVMLAGESSVANNVAQNGSGGGVAAEDNASVTLAGGSSVHSNVARNDSGGGLSVEDNARVAMFNHSSVHNNIAFVAGGGVVAFDNASVTLAGGSSVHNNTAIVAGGGVAAVDNASVMLTGSSSVHSNVARNSSGEGQSVEALARVTLLNLSSVDENSTLGGGVVAVGNASVTLDGGSSVHNNTAMAGGGVLAGDNAAVNLVGGSSVHNNTALASGGVVAVGNASVTLVGGSRVHTNTALRGGGGVFAFDNASVTVAGGSSVHNNTAVETGGGVFAFDHASVTLTSDSSVHSNSALAGGGVVAFDKASVMLTGSSSAHNNTAMETGGGVYAHGHASVTLTSGSSVHNNIVRNGSGAGLVALQHAHVTLAGGSSVHNNIVQNGSFGGLVALGSASATVTGGSSVHHNTAMEVVGGVLAHENASVTLNNGSSVHSNVAQNGSGGGLVAMGNATVTLSNGSSVHYNVAQNGSGGGVMAADNSSVIIINQSQVHHNKVLNGSGGGLVVFDRAVVNISGNSRITGNNCSNGMGGGIAVGLSVYIMDGKFTVVFGDKGLRRQDAIIDVDDSDESTAYVHISNSTVANNTSYLSAGGGLAIAKSATVELTNGTQVVGNRAVNGSGGGVVLIDYASLEVDASVVFVDNAVNRGYLGGKIAAQDSSNLQLPLRGNLTKCSPGVYLGRTPCQEGETLVYDVCTCCQRHTYSFDNTTACALCPANGNCSGGSLVDPSPGYWQSSSTSVEMHRCPLFLASCNHTLTTGDTVQTCNPGYQGNLCGACQLPDYGMVSPLRCGKCMRPAVQLVLYLLACCATVVFISYTVHATWQDNLQGGRSVRATDLIKVLVQFCQYLVIIGSVSIPWPVGFDLQRWFHLASMVFGASSGEAWSLDCWLYHDIPQLPKGVLPLAIQRQLVFFLTPGGVLVGVVVLQCLTWMAIRYVCPLMCRRRQSRTSVSRVQSAFMVVRKLPVTALVLTYYAYPTLLKASVGFFACLRIDRAAAQPGLPPPLNHPLGYWVNDIQQACFAGYHLGWALGLGLPSILLWCISVPTAMGLGLKLAGNKVDSDSFREHFGFLYRNYKPERIWWEAVWAARTVVLTLVSVFAFPMDRYFSVLALLVVFWVSAALQLFFKPYAMSTLHHMHMVSTSCLAATTLGALAMFAYDVQEATAERLRYVITALVLLINVVFAGWCCVQLAPVAKQWCASIVRLCKSCVSWVLRAILGYRVKPTQKQSKSSLPPLMPPGKSPWQSVQPHAEQV